MMITLFISTHILRLQYHLKHKGIQIKEIISQPEYQLPLLLVEQQLEQEIQQQRMEFHHNQLIQCNQHQHQHQFQQLQCKMRRLAHQ